MKPLLENWRKFLKEEAIAPYRDQLEFTEDGDIIMYHVSSDKEITRLDPTVARQKAKSYTRREYKTWDRPRVFFFTKKGQKDPSVGRISGRAYVAKVDPKTLYPIFVDPNKYNTTENREVYKKKREETQKIPSYYPVNGFEFMASMAEDDGFHGFIYPHGKEGLIVAMWNPIDVEPLEDDFY